MLRTTLHSLAASLASGLIRRTWLVAIVTIAVCAVLAARAVAAFVEAEALAPTPGGPPPPRASAPAPTLRSSPDDTGFVARNMFCSTCEPAVVTTGPGSTVSYSGHKAILIATAIGTRPNDSVATVRVPETEVQGDWSLGEHIPGVGIVDRIGWSSIDVRDSDGHSATLRLLESVAGRDDGSAKPSHDPPPADPFADRIKKIDDKTYEVSRDLVRELVSGTTKAGKVRMMPVTGSDGEIKGLRVYGVAPGSLPAAIGMRNSDLIDSIDGEKIKNAQQLLDLYAKLDKLDTVELQGKRAGKPLAIELRLK